MMGNTTMSSMHLAYYIWLSRTVPINTVHFFDDDCFLVSVTKEIWYVLSTFETYHNAWPPRNLEIFELTNLANADPTSFFSSNDAFVALSPKTLLITDMFNTWFDDEVLGLDFLGWSDRLQPLPISWTGAIWLLYALTWSLFVLLLLWFISVVLSLDVVRGVWLRNGDWYLELGSAAELMARVLS